MDAGECCASFRLVPLLDGDALGEVARLVDVAASADGDVVGEELEGDDFEDGEEEFGGGGDFQHVLDEACQVHRFLLFGCCACLESFVLLLRKSRSLRFATG